jgi:hypothetical protein
MRKYQIVVVLVLISSRISPKWDTVDAELLREIVTLRTGGDASFNTNQQSLYSKFNAETTASSWPKQTKLL